MSFSPCISNGLLATALIAPGATTPSIQAPTVKVDVPAEFQRSMAVHHFRKGEDVLHIDWMPTYAMAPMTRYAGDWPPQVRSQDDNHHWTIDVYAGSSPKVVAAYAHARDGYDADLDELSDFLQPPRPASPLVSDRHASVYFFARFHRKHFIWGDAVSFCSQQTQDTSMRTPENGHLRYEVWGVTKDRRHTVVAQVAVGHPKLETGGEEVREVVGRNPDLKRAWDDAYKRNDWRLIAKLRDETARKQMAELKNHPHSRLIESCSPDEFEPSLTAFDRMLNSLAVQ